MNPTTVANFENGISYLRAERISIFNYLFLLSKRHQVVPVDESGNGTEWEENEGRKGGGIPARRIPDCALHAKASRSHISLSIFSLCIPHSLLNLSVLLYPFLTLSSSNWIALPCRDSSITIAVCSKYSHSWQPALAWQPCFPLFLYSFLSLLFPLPLHSSHLDFPFLCVFLCNLFS